MSILKKKPEENAMFHMYSSARKELPLSRFKILKEKDKIHA